MNKNQISKLLSDIESKGYNASIEELIDQNIALKTEFLNNKFNQNIDTIFHALSNQNNSCLIIESGLGSSVETLSKIFLNIFSTHSDEDILNLQKIRMSQNEINNVTYLSTKNIFNNLKNKKFDLIFINDSNFSTNQKILQNFSTINLINELKKLLNENGCLCFGLKKGKISIDSKIESKNNQSNNIIDHKKFEKLFLKSNFSIKKFWVLPSIEKPYYSAELTNEISLKWYLKNIKKFVKNSKLSKKNKLLLFGSKINFDFSKLFLKYYSPDILFCCFNSVDPITLENLISQKSNFTNFLMISRPKKINWILIDNNGKEKKIVHFTRFGNEFPEKIINFEREIPHLEDPQERIWMESWKPGKELDLSNVTDIEMAIKWLIGFQKKTKTKNFENFELEIETCEVIESLKDFPELNNKQSLEWINQYKDYLLKNNIFKTSVHNDFWFNNILISNDKKEINVIDWEKYQKSGNPLFDFMTFFLRWITDDSNNNEEVISLKEFRLIIDRILTLKNLFKEHFGFDFDFVILFRYFLIKRIVLSKLKTKRLKVHLKLLDYVEQIK